MTNKEREKDNFINPEKNTDNGISRLSQQDKDLIIDEPLTRISMSHSKTLICHIMQDKYQEIDNIKTKTYKQDFTWKKRIWAISNKGIWYDRKGIGHAMFDVKFTDGQMYLLQLEVDKVFLDKCIICSNSIGIDAVNARDLLKRKTVNAIWGVDNSHIMLLMILAMVTLGMFAGLMYLVIENQKLNTELTTINKPASGETILVPSIILGVNHLVH